MTQHLLCLRCSKVADVEEGDRISACPNCGGRGVPADVDKRISVEITWHELRVLVIWAERFAGMGKDEEHVDMQRAVYGIADRIHEQHMDLGPLTFAGEITQVREHFGNVTTHGVPEPPPPLDDGGEAAS